MKLEAIAVIRAMSAGSTVSDVECSGEPVTSAIRSPTASSTSTFFAAISAVCLTLRAASLCAATGRLRSFMPTMQTQTEALAEKFNPQDIGAVLWSLAVLKADHGVAVLGPQAKARTDRPDIGGRQACAGLHIGRHIERAAELGVGPLRSQQVILSRPQGFPG